MTTSKLSISRLIFLAAALLIILFVFTYYIIQEQIVNAEKWELEANKKQQRTVISDAPRGEVFDTNGIALIKNETTHNITIDKTQLKGKEEKNEVILRLVNMLLEDNLMWKDSLPISKTKDENGNFVFLESDERGNSLDKKIKQLKKDADIQEFATVENVITNLIRIYDIDETLYSDEEIRTIIGVRYEMVLNNFSISNIYTFAENIPFAMVMKISESLNLPGVYIVEVPSRKYITKNLAPHLLGKVGPIYEEELEYFLNEKTGYARNDYVGKSGIEKAMEDELRGLKGEKKDYLDPFYKLINVDDSEIITPTTPGNTIKLTLDIKMQEVALKAMHRQVPIL